MNTQVDTRVFLPVPRGQAVPVCSFPCSRGAAALWELRPVLVPAPAARCLWLCCREGFVRSLSTTADLPKDVAPLAMHVFLFRCESFGDFCLQWQTHPCSGGFDGGSGAGSACVRDGSLGTIITIIIRGYGPWRVQIRGGAGCCGRVMVSACGGIGTGGSICSLGSCCCSSVPGDV